MPGRNPSELGLEEDSDKYSMGQPGRGGGFQEEPRGCKMDFKRLVTIEDIGKEVRDKGNQVLLERVCMYIENSKFIPRMRESHCRVLTKSV